jgi:hypothetical protein
MPIMTPPAAISIASFSVVTELLAELSAAGVISPDQKTNILRRAIASNKLQNTDINNSAAQLIENLLL